MKHDTARRAFAATETTRRDIVWRVPEIAERFLHGTRSVIPLGAEQIAVMLNVLAYRSRPIQSFLDLGCGDGVLGAAVLDRYPCATAVLADFSAPMLDAARKKFAGRHENVHFVECDFSAPQWVNAVEAHAPFDAVVSGYSIHHQSDERKREVYAEIFDLLSRGGMFINVEHVAPGCELTSRMFANHIIDGLYANETGGKSRDEMARTFYNAPDRAANILSPVESQCEWLRHIGFADVDVYLKIYELAVFAGRRP